MFDQSARKDYYPYQGHIPKFRCSKGYFIYIYHKTSCFGVRTCLDMDLDVFGHVGTFGLILNIFFYFLKLRDFLSESRCRPRRPPPAVPIDAYFRESDQQSKVVLSFLSGYRTFIGNIGEFNKIFYKEGSKELYIQSSQSSESISQKPIALRRLKVRDKGHFRSSRVTDVREKLGF